MFKLIKSLKISGSALCIKILNDKILILTNQYLLLHFDKNSLKIMYKKQISSKYGTQHIYDKSFSISNNLDFFVTIPDSYTSFLLKLDDSLKSVDQIKANKRAIYCSRFNNRSDILALGGEDGKLLFYSITDKMVISSLKTRPDYISNISFSKDDKFASISSFDKVTTIYSFDCSYEIKSFQSNSVIEESIFIDNNSKVIAITRDKRFIVFDIKTGISAESESKFDEWPTTLISINERYTVVGTRGSSLYIIDNAKGTIFSSLKFNNIGIVSIDIDKNHLYVTFADGEIKIIDIESKLDQFKLDIKLNKFSDASKLIKENIFLSVDASSYKFDEEWANTLSNAKKLIVANKENKAKALVAPFFFDSSKKEEFLFCLGNIEYYKKFSILITEKRYVDAFNLTDKYEFLKKTKDFDSLEKHFFKILHHCKLLFAKNDMQSINSAKKILLQYTEIKSKKILINNLLNKYSTFIQAEKLIKRRDFKLYFQLVKQNKFLEDEEYYNRVLLIGNSTFNKLNLCLHEQNYEKASEIVNYLKDFLPFKDSVEKKEKELKNKINIQKYILDNEIKKIYILVKKELNLQYYTPFVTFHEKFLVLKNKAHFLSMFGDIKNMKKLFENYLDVEYTIHALAQEFKIAYLMQIKMSLSNINKSIDWHQTISNYESMFGIDSELVNALDGQDCTQELDNLSEFNGYEKVGFLDNIVVFK